MKLLDSHDLALLMFWIFAYSTQNRVYLDLANKAREDTAFTLVYMQGTAPGKQGLIYRQMALFRIEQKGSQEIHSLDESPIPDLTSQLYWFQVPEDG